jgi:hydroxymethylglutaryl-CoA lyase
MVNMLEDMGCDTRVDLAKLLAVSRRIPAIVAHDVPGQVMKAGQTLELHEPPASLRP